MSQIHSSRITHVLQKLQMSIVDSVLRLIRLRDEKSRRLGGGGGGGEGRIHLHLMSNN